MSSGPGPTAFDSRSAGRWPGRPLLASRLRDILRRRFGAQDAWVVRGAAGCRLEARVAWKVVVLREAPEEAFWAPFYTAAVRNQYRDGHLVGVLAPTQRRSQEIEALLRDMWRQATGGPTSRN